MSDNQQKIILSISTLWHHLLSNKEAHQYIQSQRTKKCNGISSEQSKGTT